MWEDLAQRLDELRDHGRLRQLRSRQSDGVWITESDGERLLNFGSNDYLGMASFAASKLPTEKRAIGARASGLVCGWTDRHQLLADKLAQFEGTESAIVFPTGFAACSGTIASLGRRGDLILSDELNHASLIDGCRLSAASRVIYPHQDVDWIDRHLRQHRDEFERVWIVTDTVFSMDGHVAPLRELSKTAQEHRAVMVVDEAHATGVLGSKGSGLCEAMDVKEHAPIRIGTLSKAFGGQGGFVACPQTVADYLVNHCRSLIFSTALSLPAVESALIVLEHRDEMLRRKTHVNRLARKLRTTLGIDSGPVESEIPIIPIVIGSDEKAVSASNRLRRLGLFIPAIRPPTVAEGQARLRVSLSADHTTEMLDRLIEGLRSL